MIIEVKNLYVKYESEYAVKNLSFGVNAGERVAVMGPNGAGKSTLFLAMTGVLPCDAGTVTIDGISLNKKNLRLLRRCVGLLFQNPDDQLFMPTVYEDIAFGPRNFGLPETEIDERTNEILDGLGALPLKTRLIHQLSGGEKRLIALAGLLVLRPSALLLDEPTAFLDPRGSRRLAEILLQLPQTLLLATHDAAFSAKVCGRVMLMKNGGIFADANADEILGDEKLLLESGL